MSYLTPLLLALFPLPLLAAVQTFGLSLDRAIQPSAWQSSGDRNRCEFRQPIDGFGVVIFEREAGGKIQLRFKSDRPFLQKQPLELFAVPPSWNHRDLPRTLEAIPAQTTQNLKLNETIALQTLNTLERGLNAQLRQTAATPNDSALEINLNALNLQPHYGQFLACIRDLYPYKFEAVERSKLYFASGQNGLTAKEKGRLDQLIAYVKADPSVKAVEILGYTDSQGFTAQNEEVARKRAEAVQEYLQSKGAGHLEVYLHSFGERKPFASNKTAQGRATNRVVTTQLLKELRTTPIEDPNPEAYVDDTLPPLPYRYKRRTDTANRGAPATEPQPTPPTQGKDYAYPRF